MNSYKFRLYPNRNQEEKLNAMFGCNRFVWNYFLDLNNKLYLASKESDIKKKHLNYYECAGKLTELKQENVWLKEANSQALQQSIKDLDIAYNRFFTKKSGFPKFKSRKNRQSFRVPQKVSVEGKKVLMPKFREGIKVKIHRPIIGNIRFATVSRTKSGYYYVSITTDEVVTKERVADGHIGIDLGIKDFAVSSDGGRHSLPINKSGKLEFLHRNLSKKTKGSQNRAKARHKLARVYEKIHNKKEDFQHKLSDKICKENELIAIEDLNVSGMVKNHCLARSISNQSWYSFVLKLQYKSERYGGIVQKTNRFYPSSKTCNNCGHINQDLKLSDREWQCESCGMTVDRDLNAAKNILAQVERELNIKCGRNYRIKPAELSSVDEAMKQEAPALGGEWFTKDGIIYRNGIIHRK